MDLQRLSPLRPSRAGRFVRRPRGGPRVGLARMSPAWSPRSNRLRRRPVPPLSQTRGSAGRPRAATQRTPAIMHTQSLILAPEITSSLSKCIQKPQINYGRHYLVYLVRLTPPFANRDSRPCAALRGIPVVQSGCCITTSNLSTQKTHHKQRQRARELGRTSAGVDVSINWF